MTSTSTRPAMQLLQLLLFSIFTSTTIAQTMTTANNTSVQQCPSNELNYVHNGKQWCCPGAIYGGGTDHMYNDSAAFCCVGATFEVPGPSFAPCFPFCSGSADVGVTVTSTTSQPCSATVFLTDSDYSNKVTSAAASVSSEQAENSSRKSQEAASKTSAGSGAAMITSGPMMGMMVAAGGFLLAV
ncbi:unnamed protein product [Cercospora beticola]|nr:unnamed protein product [Cercospora beticola]